MRIFVTGDVHGEYDYEKLKKFRNSIGSELTLNDYLIICGDFGIIWHGGQKDNYFKNNVYKDFPCTILWVDGNHENFEELAKYPIEKWCGGKVHRITDRILHLMRGEIFNIPRSITGSEKMQEEKMVKLLAFGGAKSTDRGYDTGILRGWWREELPNVEERRNALKNLELNDNTVDYIITHDAPAKILREMFGYVRESDPDFTNFLASLAQSVNFQHWYFGHHHQDRTWGKYSCLFNSIVELAIQ